LGTMRQTFNIRDWIWFCIVIGLGFGWFGQWRQREYQHAEEMEGLAKQNEELSRELSVRDFGAKHNRESAKDAKYKAALDEANREARFRHEMQVLDNRLIEQRLESKMRKEELIYAAKTILTKEQFEEFERLRQKYHTLPLEERNMPY
jgi:uncharacterized protein HemX